MASPGLAGPGLGARSGLCHREELRGSGGRARLSLQTDTKCLACAQGRQALPRRPPGVRPWQRPQEGTGHRSTPVPSGSVWKCPLSVLGLSSSCCKHTGFQAPSRGRASMGPGPPPLCLWARTLGHPTPHPNSQPRGAEGGVGMPRARHADEGWGPVPSKGTSPRNWEIQSPLNQPYSSPACRECDHLKPF